MRILVVEDEKDLNNVLSQKLKNDGYSVDSCFDGEEAIDNLEMIEYDAIISDIMMPKLDGYAILNYLQNNKIGTPILFLTAKDAVSDRVFGLDMGASDYLVKPFSFEELEARLRVLLRKNQGLLNNILKVADLEMDINKGLVKRANKEIRLSAKEYNLLEYLMRNVNIVLSREKIENHIWNLEYEGGTNVVDVYIRYLRKKIDDNHEQKLIHTLRGRGYMLGDNYED